MIFTSKMPFCSLYQDFFDLNSYYFLIFEHTTPDLMLKTAPKLRHHIQPRVFAIPGG